MQLIDLPKDPAQERRLDHGHKPSRVGLALQYEALAERVNRGKIVVGEGAQSK